MVKEGFKRTEEGLIPEDWTITTLGDVVEFLDGKRRPVKDSERAKMRGIYPYYGASGIVDYVSNYLFDEDLILLGEDGENILSRNLPLAFRVSGKIWVNNHAHVLRPLEKCNIGYLTEYLESIDYSIFNSGTAQPKLNKRSCARLPVVLPPLPEQHAIANALSDADALIASLDALIAKKRDIKQAAMQQLLTGKIRVPGFREAWRLKRLGDIAPLQRGFDLPTIQIQTGPYPVVYSNGILNFHRKYQVRGPGIVTGRSGTIGKVTFVSENFWPHNTALWVTDYKGNDPKFIFYLYSTLAFERFATGSGVPTLNRNDVHAFETKIPASPEEQAAIAAVLADMDAELAALEAKRDKARAVKQGMMQELLTGRLRLV